MDQTRQASVTWSGTLQDGAGTITNVSSGAFGGLPVSWPARTEAHGGKTSPEELLAAAHASCFSMSLSGRLTRNGTPPERLETTAKVTFEKREAGWAVAASALTVIGTVPGIDEGTFQSLANGAKDGCPISGALKGNVELSVDARLAKASA
jgi:osmotically inducible protein OsmC